MPKVTLRGAFGQTYAIAYGANVYEFTNGVPRTVPPPIALEAMKKIGSDGRPMFRVDMGAEVVATPKKAKRTSKRTQSTEQTVPADQQQQLTF